MQPEWSLYLKKLKEVGFQLWAGQVTWVCHASESEQSRALVGIQSSVWNNCLCKR